MGRDYIQASPSVRAALWGVLGFVIFIEVSGIEQTPCKLWRPFSSSLLSIAFAWKTTGHRFVDDSIEIWRCSAIFEGRRMFVVPGSKTTRWKSTTIVRVRSDWQLEQLKRTQTFELREFYWVVPSDFEVREGEQTSSSSPDCVLAWLDESQVAEFFNSHLGMFHSIYAGDAMSSRV